MTAQVTVGLDGSMESLAALRWAATEAVLREVPLRLVHVDEWPNTPEVPLPYAHTMAERAESLLRDEAARVRKDHPGLKVLTERARGRAAEELTAAANEADLTVLGSRGLGGVRAFIVGSVSLPSSARRDSRSSSCARRTAERLPKAGSWWASTSTTRAKPCSRSPSTKPPAGACPCGSCTAGHFLPRTATQPSLTRGSARSWAATFSGAGPPAGTVAEAVRGRGSVGQGGGGLARVPAGRGVTDGATRHRGTPESDSPSRPASGPCRPRGHPPQPHAGRHRPLVAVVPLM